MSDRKRPREETDEHDEAAVAASAEFLWNLDPKPSSSTTNDGNADLFVLSSSYMDTLCLTGRGRLRCIDSCGPLIMNGYTLTSDFVYFESPSWSSWATISGVCPRSRIELQSIESEEADDNDGVMNGPSFHIHNPRDIGTRPTAISTAWKSAMETILQDFAAQQLAQSKQEQLPAMFQPSLDDDEAPAAASFRVAVTGAKGVGKSTFLRLLINQSFLYCSHVALLDLDLGQPELSPPSFVSLSIVNQPLLQPPSTRLYRPNHSAYYFGSITSEADPTRYVECLEQALADYKSLVASEATTGLLPLFINCDGFVKGLGETLLQTLLQKLEPTFVVKIVGGLRSQQFDVGDMAEATTVMSVDTILQRHLPAQPEPPAPPCSNETAIEHSVNHGPAMPTGTGEVHQSSRCTCQTAAIFPLAPLQSPLPLSVAAALYRDQRLISYFLRDESLWDSIGFSHDGIDDPACEIGRRLAAQQPYKVPLEAVQLEFASPELGRDISCLESMLDIINGSVVGLCCRKIKVADSKPDAGDQPDSSSAANAVPTHLLPCLGLGIVRSIDRMNGVLYVLTPVPLHILNHVNVLSIGSIFLPLECYFQGVMAESFPYLSIVPGGQLADVIGAEPMQSRNSIARKSLMRTA